MEARALQLHAYKAAIDALRASSNPNSPGTIKLLRQLRNVFKVSELRHAAEVRRACSDPALAQLSEVSAAAWLRKVRRPVESGPLIGVRRESRRKLADELVKQISQAQETPTVHLSLDNEELLARLSPPPTPTPSISEKKSEHVIHLPRGTIITVGEEKQESTKPGRKRKGDMVIKEVKMIEQKRQRRKPPRFQHSPDKHIVKNAIRAARRRQCIDHALKKPKIEIKTEPTVAIPVKAKPEMAKTNGHVVTDAKPVQVLHQVQQQPGKKQLVKQHLPTQNLVTTATTVLMKPTVYTVTHPMQAVHIVSSHHPKTISSASVAQQSASSFSMADILNKDAMSASSRPSSTAPPGATAPSVASSGGSNHVTPTKPPNIDVTPSANSTKAQFPQQSPLPQSPQLHRQKPNNNLPQSTQAAQVAVQSAAQCYYQQQQKNAEHTQELQRKILGTAAKTPSYIGGPIVDVTPRGVGRAPTPGHKEHAYAKSYVMAGQQQQQQQRQQQTTKQQQATMRKQQQQQSRVHQTVTSLPSSYQRAASSPAYVLPPNYAVPLDLQQRQLLRPGVHLIDNQALLTQNPHTLISTGLQRFQPLLLHPSFPGSLIAHPQQGAPHQLQLNGQQPYSSIELARLQQTQPNNNNR